MRTKYFNLSMSPPPKQICVDHLVTAISDLDTVELEKNIKDKKLKDKKLKAVPAKEHDDGSPQVNMSEGVQENGIAGKCVELPMDDVKHADNFEFLPTDSPTTPSSLCMKSEPSDDHPTPSSLCARSNPSDDHHKSSGHFCDSSQKRKRKNKLKGSRNKNKSKRCKTSHGSCVQHGSILNVGKTVGGGGTKTNQTGNNGGCPAKVNNATNGTGTSAGMQANPRGNRGGGGGGDGDGDGNNPPRKLNHLACDSPSTPIKISLKQRKPNSMDVDSPKSSSPDSGMDTAGSPPTGTDVHMVTSPEVEKAEQKPPRPEKRPPENIELSPEFLTGWHTRINHCAYKNQSQCKCKICCWTKIQMSHFLEERKNDCDCRNCKIWPRVLDHHKAKCRNNNCFVCEAWRKVEPAPTRVAVNPTVQNITTPQSSFDAEEKVIYWNDSLQNACLSHFREDEDYIFKDQEVVGGGGHGTVHDIFLNPKFKDQYPGFLPENVVVKKTTLGQDEKEVLKAIACHPNFVKTCFVVNKTEFTKIGENVKECKHRIFMEKCDMSLKEYSDEKWKNGEVLDKYEAMHYWTQVLDAVVHLHTWRTPIIHKDIKPGNVLLTFETNLIRAMLADFDAVRLLYNEYTEPGLPPQGTENYIAPEVWYSQVHGRPADIYSMGKFLLELLCRKERNNTQLALKKLKGIDYDLGVLIEKCLQINPYDRPTAIEIRDSQAVKKYLSSSDVSMSQPENA